MGETKTCVVLLVGLPAAGKTTFCKYYIKPDDDTKLKLIHYDDLVENFTSSSRKLIFQQVAYLIQDCLLGKSKNVIIIDDNMYYKSMRKQYINICKRYNLGFFQIYFQVDLQTALMRNVNRGNSVPSNIIIDMYKKLEVPTDQVLVINSNSPFQENDLSQFRRCLCEAFQNPLRDTSDYNVMTSLKHASSLHYIDLMLRRIVNDMIKINDKRNMKAYIITKKVLFKNIKNGNINLNYITYQYMWMAVPPFFDFIKL